MDARHRAGALGLRGAGNLIKESCALLCTPCAGPLKTAHVHHYDGPARRRPSAFVTARELYSRSHRPCKILAALSMCWEGDTVYVTQNSCRTATVRTTGVVQELPPVKCHGSHLGFRGLGVQGFGV